MTLSVDDRAAQVLRCIVEDYVATAEPVGSRTVSKRMEPTLSPATIRNIMADLEEIGFLSQPHTSAGRIPTAVGFRFYIDNLLLRRSLMLGEEKQLKLAACKAGAGESPDDLVRHMSRLLSRLAGQASVVIVSSPDQQLLRCISLMRASTDKILMVAVMQSGHVQHRLIEGESDITSDDLEKINAYLNSLTEGLTLTQLRMKVRSEMRREMVRYDRVMQRALAMSARALDESAHGEVFIEGRANILEQPEFVEDVKRLKRILRAFEEKAVIYRLLDRAMTGEAIQVSIGRENEVEELGDVSVVASGYRHGDSSMGSIGLIGPVRMDYSRMIPLVEYTANLLTVLFKQR
ncbi:MAG: heat-inducible transcriptional repressor HrcA [Syntrophorhabdaceae bacterium]|nr:heat-inducible transcriptional repressor HrcA [Syntrophorhabdaceae bacterium]